MHKLLLPPLLSLFLAATSMASTFAQTLDQTSNPIEPSLTQRIAEPLGTLTLPSVLELAFRANPGLAAASREVDAADGAIRQAGIIPNPEFAATIEDRNKETRTTTLQINQPIELGGKRSARIAAAERARDIANAELNTKRAELRATVTTAFYDALIAQERHRLTLASVELAKNATTAASKRVTAGKISPVEATKARIAEAGVRIELAQAANELSQAKRRLSATWGSKTPRFRHIDAAVDALPDVPLLDDLMQSLQKAPMLSHARLEVARREALDQVERSRQIPDITFNLGTKRDRELGRNQLIVGFAIPIPVFDRNQGNLQEALHRTDKARHELIATEVQLNTELAQAHERLTTTREEAELLQQEVLPNAQSAYDAAAKGFELGKFNFLDLLDAQRTLFQTKSQYLRTLSETHRAAAEIERIVGNAKESQ